MAKGNGNFDWNFDLMQESMARMWEMWLAGWEGFNWGLEQMEEMARIQMEQGNMWDGWMKLSDEMIKQMLTSQEQFQEMFLAAVLNPMEMFKLPTWKV